MSLILPQRGRLSQKSTPLSYSFLSYNGSGTNSNTYTFSNVSIGAAPGAGERRWIIAVPFSSGGTGDGAIPTSVTCGGVNMINIDHGEGAAGGGNAGCGIWYLEVTTGTTATFVVNLGASPNRGGVNVYRIISDDNGIAITDNANQSASGTQLAGWTGISCGAGGVVIGGAHATNGGPFTVTTDITEDSDQTPEGTNYSCVGSAAFPIADPGIDILFDSSTTGDAEAAVYAVFEPV